MRKRNSNVQVEIIQGKKVDFYVYVIFFGDLINLKLFDIGKYDIEKYFKIMK